MKSRPSLTPLVCGLAAALSQITAGTALADSAVGTDTALGNAMNTAADTTRPPDPDYPGGRHTPTGQLNSIPFAQQADLYKTATGWEISGQMEVGALGGNANNKNAQFRMYKDLGNGAYLNNFGLQAEKPDQAFFVELVGGGVARDDQYYGLQFGRYNDWKVKTFYSQLPHVFTGNYSSIWSGVGTANMTLVPGLASGGTASVANDNANVRAAIVNAENSSLTVTRKKGGARYDINLSHSWKAYASYTLEQREGARAFGAVWGGGGGTAPIEIAEPVDNETHELLAGLQYGDGLNALNLRLSGSLFRNRNDTLTFQQPYRLFAGVANGVAAGGFTQGRFDLHPNNEAYNVKAEYARSLPDFYKGRFTVVAGLGTYRQNDNLIPYTTIPGVTLDNVTGNNWNTTDSLSRKSAAARVDTRLIDLGLTMAPTATLNLKGKLRYYETDNKINPFLACNPNARYVDLNPNAAGAQAGGLTLDGCTGVWGRILNDGTGQSVLMGANSAQAGNLPIISIPFEYKQYNIGLSADRSFTKVSSLNAAYEREVFHRAHRERDKTWEDKVKIGYVNRGLPDSTLRVSYDYADRRGGAYDTAAYAEFVSAALAPMPTAQGSNVASWAVHMNNGIRKFDLADRKRQTLDVRLNSMWRPDLDAGAALQLRQTAYPDSDYGRTKQSLGSVNLDLNYQPSVERTIYGFYSFQYGRNRQVAISSIGACTIGQVTGLGTITPGNAAAICAAPGGPLYPLQNTWSATGTDHNHVVGFGLTQAIRTYRLNLNYTLSWGRSEIGYDYTPGGAVTAANAVFAGSGMPDIATLQHIFDASLLVPISPRITARLMYRYEYGRINDWHYQNLDGTPVVLGATGAAALPVAVVLDGGPQKFKANVFGAMLQIKL